MEFFFYLFLAYNIFFFGSSGIKYHETRNKDGISIGGYPEGYRKSKKEIIKWAHHHRDGIQKSYRACERCGKKIKGTLEFDYSKNDVVEQKKGIFGTKNR